MATFGAVAGQRTQLLKQMKLQKTFLYPSGEIFTYKEISGGAKAEMALTQIDEGPGVLVAGSVSTLPQRYGSKHILGNEDRELDPSLRKKAIPNHCLAGGATTLPADSLGQFPVYIPVDSLGNYVRVDNEPLVLLVDSSDSNKTSTFFGKAALSAYRQWKNGKAIGMPAGTYPIPQRVRDSCAAFVQKEM